MPSVPPSQNPFIHGFFPIEGESPQGRAQREREEAEAEVVSNAIDEKIRQDKVTARKNRTAIKILLLGQSESGQCANIKA